MEASLNTYLLTSSSRSKVVWLYRYNSRINSFSEVHSSQNEVAGIRTLWEFRCRNQPHLQVVNAWLLYHSCIKCLQLGHRRPHPVQSEAVRQRADALTDDLQCPICFVGPINSSVQRWIPWPQCLAPAPWSAYHLYGGILPRGSLS